jgi:hypothetical protein
MQSTKVYPGEILPGISIGDVVVSLTQQSQHREEGDIFEVLSKSTRNCLYYRTRKSNQDDVNSNNDNSFRKATPEETAWYKSTYKEGMFLNIKDMPKDQVINTYEIY